LDDTGLYYYGARYYDPTIGRFISPDLFVQWSTGVDVVSYTLTVNAAALSNSPAKTIQAPVNPQALNRYSYVLNNPLAYTDPYGSLTIGVGLAGSAWWRWGVSGSILFVVDDKGNFGVLVSRGGGRFIGSPGAGGGAQVQVTGADTIFDLEGGAAQIGGSVGFMAGPVPVSVTPEYVGGENYNGGQITGGLGTLGLEGHVVIEDAYLIYSNVLPDMEGAFDDGSFDVGILASSAVLDLIGVVADDQQLEMIIDTIYTEVAANLEPGQGVGWSSSQGYHAVDTSSYYYDDWW
jgi:hypothetical protein